MGQIRANTPKVQAHLDSLPDEKLTECLQLILVSFETFAARSETKRRNARALELINILAGEPARAIEARQFLHDVAQRWPWDSMIFLQLRDE